MLRHTSEILLEEVKMDKIKEFKEKLSPVLKVLQENNDTEQNMYIQCRDFFLENIHSELEENDFYEIEKCIQFMVRIDLLHKEYATNFLVSIGLRNKNFYIKDKIALQTQIDDSMRAKRKNSFSQGLNACCSGFFVHIVRKLQGKYAKTASDVASDIFSMNPDTVMNQFKLIDAELEENQELPETFSLYLYSLFFAHLADKKIDWKQYYISRAYHTNKLNAHDGVLNSILAFKGATALRAIHYLQQNIDSPLMSPFFNKDSCHKIQALDTNNFTNFLPFPERDVAHILFATCTLKLFEKINLKTNKMDELKNLLSLIYGGGQITYPPYSV